MAAHKSQSLRLRAPFHRLPLFYLRAENLCAYARITQQWKPTLKKKKKKMVLKSSFFH